MKQVLPLIQAQFDRMCATGKLFQSSVSGNEIIAKKKDEALENKSIEELEKMLEE